MNPPHGWTRVIAAISVVAVFLVSAAQPVFANGTITVTDRTNDLIMGAFEQVSDQAIPAPSNYYVIFRDIVEAHVSLQSGTYTFEESMVGVPSDWLSSTWAPTFPSQPGNPAISIVAYRWELFDSSGSVVGFIVVRWSGGVTIVGLARCLPSAAGCVNFTRLKPSSLSSPTLSGSSLSVTISQSDLLGILPTADQWRARSHGFLSAVGSAYVGDWAPDLGCTTVCLASEVPLPA